MFPNFNGVYTYRSSDSGIRLIYRTDLREGSRQMENGQNVAACQRVTAAKFGDTGIQKRKSARSSNGGEKATTSSRCVRSFTTRTGRVAPLHTRLPSLQPYRAAFLSRRRRASRIARGVRRVASHPGFRSQGNRTPTGCEAL